ncbi:NADH-quinone oxidoreductase subunit NuoE [Mesorhizobium sp. RP14(2022)]|uniref:NADH-quinone oxidoreductase subunit NuoE n=1 Tax=Mesorhizobium liriopis TaxID=2953882 RepID=A0ABT1C975_9HYPH|nr:NADH-quinone oxidoreductase subunit NuoE [Mesorhizobium liriopis]MCO6050735.1 NADH-quinone oxidoreductase subunit NuoE [Mesorhizobium liriopis]
MSVRRLAAAEVQPTGFAFSNDNAAWAQDFITHYPDGRQQSAVIPLLMRAQEQEGWVTKAAIETIADMLGMPYIRALEVATFYTQFQLKPVGTKAHVQVCGTTPCMLRGAGDLIEVCKSKIHHDQFHLNDDGTLSWEEVECLGACVNAPMVMIFKDTYEDLTPERLAEIIDVFEAGQGAQVPVGPQNGRWGSIAKDKQTALLDEQAVVDANNDRKAKAAAAAVAPTEADTPPSQAAKPDTSAIETNAAVKSPSPEKVAPGQETGSKDVAPAYDKKAADKADPRVEGGDKDRERPTAQPGDADVKSPELHKGATVSANEKKPLDENKRPESAPSPEGKTVGNTGPEAGAPETEGEE